jgi:predicted nucleic acid-binding protein
MAPASGLLLDTDVVAELRGPSPHPTVAEFLRRRRHFRIFVSALTIGELHLLSRQNEHFQEMDAWLDEFKERFRPNILPVDVDVAAAWGPLSGDPAVAAIDSLIAATALHKGLCVISGNADAYRRLAVPALNPWSEGTTSSTPTE